MFNDYKPEFDLRTNEPKKNRHIKSIRKSKNDGAF